MPRLYLAGPITGCSFEECDDWRTGVRRHLGEYGIACFSPLRGLEHLMNEKALFTGDYDADHPLSNDTGSTVRCRDDILRSDAVLVNFLGAVRVSIGTCIELGWADAFRKPVIAVMETAGNIHEHALVRGTIGFRLPTLPAAVQMVKQLLLPDVEEADTERLRLQEQLARATASVEDSKRELVKDKERAELIQKLHRESFQEKKA